MTTTNNSAARERPILFSAPMVRAILDGTKTQTRRVLKPQPKLIPPRSWAGCAGKHWWACDAVRSMVEIEDELQGTDKSMAWCLNPYGKPGDRLWVREAWQFYDWTEYGEPCIRYAADDARLWPEIEDEQTGLKLMDVWAALSDPENYAIDNRAADRRWRPSIHMPRWACRIMPEVTGVRVERLQDISAEDCIAEGLTTNLREHDAVMHLRDQFRDLWISTGGDWDANPWVWVVEFKRVDNNEEKANGGG